MSCIRIMKFGGAAVASAESFSKIADLISKDVSTKTIVVVSAMGDTTDELIALSQKVHPLPPKRELDMLLTVGERISISLLAMALDRKGVAAESFTGSQSGIITCSLHTDAKIVDVRPKRLLRCLESQKIAIVAGFQGVSQEGEITTLGRGGSDTTAVALAAALGAPAVEFYKDVPGLFTEDPKLDPKAKAIPNLTYEQATALIQKTGSVLHPRCLSLAQKNCLSLYIRSFKSQEGKTLISDTFLSPPKAPVYEIS